MSDLKQKAAKRAKDDLEWELDDIEQLYKIKLDERVIRQIKRVVEKVAKSTVDLVKSEIAGL